ncbi:4Fe-4S dicluster domain-containing protein [Buttiauxella gaviniae]|jgi:ferredoxin-like protein FixX|uniref:4Fe-4S dicluster domain-containing protein n=1 Tax=Buttiauxella gaviniae TaxID=82990 RepID=UPI0039AEB906
MKPESEAHIIPASLVPPAMQDLLVKCCPAGLYKTDDNGRLRVESHGCLECGTCRLLADEQTLESWRYPSAGRGIQFRFG